MNKRMRELLSQMDTLKTEVRSLLAEDNVEAAETKMDEVRAMQRKIDIHRQLDEQFEQEQRAARPAGEQRDEAEQEAEYRSAFMAAVRGRRLTSEQRDVLEQRAMVEGVPEDGGLIVPQDISTKINELRRKLNDLSRYITVEPVTALSGSRVLEKDAEMTPFVEITELQNIPEMDNPKFRSLAYSCKDRAGILPVSNNLLRDSDQKLEAYLTRWIAKKHVVTRNLLITNQLATLTPQALATVDDIKYVLDVELDPAISLSSVILTNQFGYHWLNTQKDADGRDLLQPDITRPGRKLFQGRPIVPVANRFLPNETGTPDQIPMYIGDLKELLVLFDRQTYEIKATDVGGDAFKRNTTDIRVITREDIQLWDDGAAVYCQIAAS